MKSIIIFLFFLSMGTSVICQNSSKTPLYLGSEFTIGNIIPETLGLSTYGLSLGLLAEYERFDSEYYVAAGQSFKGGIEYPFNKFKFGEIGMNFMSNSKKHHKKVTGHMGLGVKFQLGHGYNNKSQNEYNFYSYGHFIEAFYLVRFKLNNGHRLFLKVKSEIPRIYLLEGKSISIGYNFKT